MQIKNNFITSDENVMKHEFQSHPPDPNGALLLAYNVMNYE